MGEHWYKPFAGACIRRLQAELNKEPPPPLEKTLHAHQLEINSSTFPWLSPEQENHRPPATPDAEKRPSPRKARSAAQSRTIRGSAVQQLVQDVEQLSLASPQEDYVIPERDFFIWLLD